MAQDTDVLLVLVATNGSSWLPDTIAAIKAQTHERLSVVAVDNASTDSSRALLQKAFGKEAVVSLERRAGYGRALVAAMKAAGERAKSAGAFLILHDDCAMQPGTVAALVDALDYEDVAIAGPKLVEWDDPDVMQEAGLSIDRYARLFDPLERGELDQGQHDKVREVFWVSSACMLMKRSLVEKIGFFDTRFVLFREDLDFCWRARNAGAKVAYCGTTKARHAAASLRGTREGWATGRVRYFVERNLLASLIQNYSRATLVLVLPAAVLLSLVSALLYLIAGRRSASGQILEAVRWNVAHFASTIRARTRAQRARAVPDAEVMKLAMRGAHRVRSLAERIFERVAGEPAEGVEEAEGLATPGQRVRRGVIERLRSHPFAAGVVVLVVLYVIGSRALMRGGPIAGTDMPPFPGAPSDLFRAFFSGWRIAGTGGAAPAPPAVFIAGVLSVVTLGSTWLAQRVLIAALLPLAGLSASRLASTLGCGVVARRIAGFTYALSPLALFALGQGRLADLVLIAAAPGICAPLARAAGFAPWKGWRDLIVPGIALAFAAAFAPWVLVFVAMAGIVFAFAAAVTGRRATAIRPIAAAAIMGGGVIVGLLPWSIELFGAGSPLGIGGRAGPVAAQDLVRLVAGTPSPIPPLLAIAFPLAAAGALILAPADRDAAARALAVAALAGFAMAWAVSRGVPWIAPRPAQPLALAAVGIAVLVGLGAEGLQPALRRRGFGAGQLASAIVALGLVVAVAAGGVWLVQGTRPGIQPAGELAPAFLAADRRTGGEFRVLWIDGSAGDVRFDLTGPLGETMQSYGERPDGEGLRVLGRLISGVAGGRIDSVGRQFGVFGIRYVFVRASASPELKVAFERQSDLRFEQRFNGMAVYENDLSIPLASGIGSQNWAAASQAQRAPESISGTTGSPEAGPGFMRTRNDLYEGTVRQGAKRVLLATEYDPGWRLAVPDSNRGAPSQRAFGWANGFAAAAAGDTALVWQGQSRYRLMLLGQLALLVGAAILWSRRVAAERGER